MRERERIERAGVGNTVRGSFRNPIKDPRVWNREEYHRLETESFSIFLDNIPEDISKRELFELFSWTGRINDIYLSRKQKNGSLYIFAFVRYTTRGGALKAITEMNRMRLRGKVVFVGEARYRRMSIANGTNKIQAEGIIQKESVGQPQKEHKDDPAVPASSSKNVGKDKKILDQHGNGLTKNLEVAVAKENLNWLQKSLVGGTTTAIDFRSLQDMVAKNFP
ncbi:uncharacterized protein LOC130945964 [Arachis stenosperma]|uniref:uncharacterized protein LOC130945964 n=1 Tax=Arachis stenosperma TaxID=217475 RepID=UPI0025AD86C2|nr:uncharacterized protein LOC130945964 [Arachis stenosperma]